MSLYRDNSQVQRLQLAQSLRGNKPPKQVSQANKNPGSCCEFGES
jgi:hypothetical protein